MRVAIRVHAHALAAALNIEYVAICLRAGRRRHVAGSPIVASSRMHL